MDRKRWEAAPNPEWVLMYRGGLARAQIVKLVGAVSSTVGYHLDVARKADPELQAAHETAAALRTTHAPTAGGLEHLREVVTFVRTTGRFPSRATTSETERTLAAWLTHRRAEARDGTLAPAYRDGLAVLDGWKIPSRAESDEARWQERLAALVEYRNAGNDWPRHKAPATGLEHDLGVWLHFQRAKLHRGELDEAKIRELDRALPGWSEGRKRGRKPHRAGSSL
ncbi:MULTISPECIES: helicase associated domain-containing protein [Terrabacteria group]|uniref:helicase associated domain-containing protein n=1 Tax=Bacillati TaxID=1783272 RepID=UPI00362E78DC